MDIEKLTGEEAIKQKKWDEMANSLTFEDGVNLVQQIVLDIIKREDDEAGNLDNMLTNPINEALQDIQEKYSINRVNQLYKHFGLNLD